MILAKAYRTLIIKIITVLYILLFVYASANKLIDYETFIVQLAQSPLLSAFAGIIAWLIPVLEIGVATFLVIHRFRAAALYASFLLMVMFTTYIYIILNFSEFIPCSCGGVLEKLSWTQHLILNFVFIVLAVLAIYFSENINNKMKLLLLSTLTILGIGVITLLFVFSERTMHRNNAFIRRYPHNPATEGNAFDLIYNSWYIAGLNKGRIYLGNTTSPLTVKVLDTALKPIDEYKIGLNDSTLPFRRAKVSVIPPYFFLSDGTVPVIFRGKVSDWFAKRILEKQIYFDNAVPMDSVNLGIKTESGSTGETILGCIDLSRETSFTLAENLLEKKLDGVFGKEGNLLFNQQLNKLIYGYTYRNQYLVVNRDLSLNHAAHTIDTIQMASLQLKHLEAKGQVKLINPTVAVNGNIATYGKYLFVNSNRLGKYEADEMLEQATIIDVYNIPEQSYLFSFYIYKKKGFKLKEFRVYGHTLIVIMGHYIVRYQLNSNEFQNNIKEN